MIFSPLQVLRRWSFGHVAAARIWPAVFSAPPAFLSILVELIAAGTIHLSLHPPQGLSGLSDALDYAKERETGTLRSCHWAGNVTGGIAWYHANDGGSTRAVGTKTANGFGLHDMIGNVWEWVEDCWHPDYNGAPSMADVWTGGDCSFRMLRGGSWSLHDVGVDYLRVSNRYKQNPEHWSDGVGIRCAK